MLKKLYIRRELTVNKNYFVVILQNARHVIGVELCSDAVEDAKTNAHINGNQFVIGNLCLLLL